MGDVRFQPLIFRAVSLILISSLCLKKIQDTIAVGGAPRRRKGALLLSYLSGSPSPTAAPMTLVASSTTAAAAPRNADTAESVTSSVAWHLGSGIKIGLVTWIRGGCWSKMTAKMVHPKGRRKEKKFKASKPFHVTCISSYHLKVTDSKDLVKVSLC